MKFATILFCLQCFICKSYSQISNSGFRSNVSHQMKKLLFILGSIFILMLGISNAQSGYRVIYNSEYGISKFRSIPLANGKKKMFVQLPCTWSFPNPFISGRFIAYNNSSDSWYEPFDNFLLARWAYDSFNQAWHCNPIEFFTFYRNDTNIVFKHTTSVISDCCPVEDNFITFNGGIDSTQCFRAGWGSQFCGLEIDSTGDTFLSDPIYFLIGYYVHGDNLLNVGVFLKEYYQGFEFDPVKLNTITGLKSLESGGFLKINPVDERYVYTVSNDLLLSTNKGISFSSTGIPAVRNVLFNETDSTTYAYGNSRFYSSSNYGVTWASVQVPIDIKYAETDPDNDNIIYSGNENGIHRSTDKGMTWNLYFNAFEGSRNVIGLSKEFNSGDTLFASTGIKVYKIWESVITEIETITENAVSFELFQNYPNPFNPSTSIKFYLPRATNISVVVYDALGNEVATIDNGMKSMGNHIVEFNAEGFPSGVYFCTLQTASGVLLSSIRMLLVK